MGCKTLTGLGINLRDNRDFGSGSHNFYWDAELCSMLLLGYGMGLIFYRDRGMVPPGTEPHNRMEVLATSAYRLRVNARVYR